MQNSVIAEINILISYFLLGGVCGLIFDLFKAFRYGKAIRTWQLFFQDTLYYCIVSVIVFIYILRINGAEIRGYMVCSALAAFVLYRTVLSQYFVRILVCTGKVLKYVIKMAVLPVMFVCKIVSLPLLKIKQKLLSKKTKISLTFKQFCFKIKCNVGMLCRSNKICKERKPCRRKQKPEKRV